MEFINEIKKLLEAGKLIIGEDKTLKELRAGTLKKIFLAANAKPELREDLAHYAQVSSVEIVQLEVPNDELGALCKKPFSIQVLSTK